MLLNLRSLPSLLLISFLATTNIFIADAQIKLKKGAPHVLLKNPKSMLRGTVKNSRDGQPYYSFKGVRYAQPPKRFQLPEPLLEEEPQGQGRSQIPVHDAFEFGPSCARWSRFLKKYTGSEDCLFLNVYVPMRQVSGPLPVMLYIHGGAFVDGESDTHGPDYFMDEDVILVVINYRLGALGFLSTGDSIVPGNMALHDQATAIKWVHENIESFGGDPNQIILFGESAGGVSVNLQMLYPPNKGLISGVISQSGTVHCPWAIKHPIVAEHYFRKLAKLSGCENEESSSSLTDTDTSSKEEIVDCLREKPWEELLEAQNKSQEWFPGLSIPFAPVVESENQPEGWRSFLTEHPDYLMETGQFINVPYIVGINEEEGYFVYSEVILKNGKLMHALNTRFHEVGPSLYQYEHALKDTNHMDTVSTKIRDFYFGDQDVHPQGLVDLSSDISFITGIRLTAQTMARHNAKVFAYVFNYKGEFTLVRSLMEENKVVVSHADELQYLFKTTRFGAKDGIPKNSESELISKNFVKLWASFAKHGTPTKSSWGEQNHHTANWKRVPKDGNISWFQLNSKPSMLESLHSTRHEFWSELKDEYFHNYKEKKKNIDQKIEL